MNVARVGIILLTASIWLSACSDMRPGQSDDPASAKVILIIGDGMDDQQITIARNYLAGRDGTLVLDSMQHRGSVRVYGVSEENPDEVTYVTDSAGTATAMATGVVTSPMRVGTTAGAGETLVNIFELASQSDIQTGIVTTSSLTDATPASFVAHINHRWCQGPESMDGEFRLVPGLSWNCHASGLESGGPGSIAEQIASSRIEILLGGGSEHFEQVTSWGATVLDQAVEQGFQIITRSDELESLTGESRVLGLFSPDTMPVMWRGENGAQAVQLEKVDGEVIMPEPFACEPNPEFAEMPTLVKMATAAIEHLDQYDSFMLMIESASIDKQSHARRPCGHIGELSQLDATLKLALDFADRNPETLVLVTADHGHAAHIISETDFLAVRGYGTPGFLARVRTPEGSVMGVNYGTTNFPRISRHTGAQVPLFASGPGADELPTFIEQPDIFRIAAQHLGVLEQ